MSRNRRAGGSKQFWLKQVQEQRKWIEEHGGSEYAYCQRYGDASIGSDWIYGDGGVAIYKADTNALREYEQKAGLR